MLDTHRFGAVACVSIVSIALTLSFVVRANTPLPPATTEPTFIASVPGQPVPETYAILPLASAVQGASTTATATKAIQAKSAAIAVAGEQTASPVVRSGAATAAQSRYTPRIQSSVGAAPNTAEGIDTAAFKTALAQRIHALTNAERAKSDLPALAYDGVLAQNAASYSARMQAEDFLDHVDPDGCNMTCRFAADHYVARYWGENLARWRSSYEPSLDELATYFVREWVKSSSHRDNLLSPNFTHEGIGVAIDGNEVFVTVHFAEPM